MRVVASLHLNRKGNVLSLSLRVLNWIFPLREALRETFFCNYCLYICAYYKTDSFFFRGEKTAILEIGEAVVCFNINNGRTVLKCRRVVTAPRRIGRLRVTRRRDWCTGDGRVCHVSSRTRDNRHARSRRRHAGWVRLPAHVLGIWQFVVLFPLHAPVLEPDFDLTLRQAEAVSDFNPAASCQVAIKMKFLFQFEYLMTSVGRTLPFRFHSGCESSSSVIHYSTDNI